MAKAKQKVKRLGYALRIVRPGDNSEWERVGYCFHSRYEAETYRERHYPNVKKWTVTGIRLNVEPVRVPSRFEEERA